MGSMSPTPRELRRLASDHDFVLGAYPPPRRLGWWAFVATHLSLPASLCAGAIFVIVAIVYTNSISRQLLECPTWAEGCTTTDAWTVDHLATVQGVITFLFSIGMAALAYVALALCEAAIWPLLSHQVFTIKGLEAYLATSRGAVIWAPAALMSIKTLATGIVLACAVTVTLIPFVAAPLVGYAFTPTWQTAELKSNYTTGGGIAELYAQTDPPTSVIVGVQAEYNSWATDPSSEPLSEYRDWYVDRSALSQRGNFAAAAVRFQTSITCRPHEIKQVDRDGLLWNAFATNMTRTNTNSTQVGDKNSSAEVWVRAQPQLTLWVDDFTFVSPHRTSATLVFAALNGTIDGGSWTPLTLGAMTGASSVACDVDIEAVDDTLVVGTNTSQPLSNQTILSSLSSLQLSTSASNNTAINELLLWFAVAPLMAGISVDGTQPMFFNSTTTNLPFSYTTSTPSRNTWTTAGLQSFIRLAIGALAQATSTSTSTTTSQPPTNTTLTTHIATKKMDPSRAALLSLLPLLILVFTAALAIWLARVHATDKLPVMRLAGAGELLKSSQTRWLREQSATDGAKAYLPNELGGVEVKFGVDKDGIVGLARSAGYCLEY
ncbi:hypothetical protein B0T22DRAFT_499176 [Podospora appendiculata]|uniref:Transmembrane protein n=1 Tax=Podospora appendiculata TaxID=314037 RepID=A0AAE0XC11_9PEZI|nr:hypothetical protein B0T22DRAFT_499176 [Podospora appendiculata]